MSSIWKLFIGILAICAVMAGAFLAGSYTDRYLINKRAEGLKDTSLIAIVNMDNGIVRDGKYINYASELIELTNPNYVMTGLKEAQEGIVSGAYAAYIVLPETLSSTVTELEREPDMVKAEVIYADCLTDEAYRRATLDVKAFETDLSTNISYMYIDSMMKELHKAQDETGKILSNDDMELNLLTSVDANELIAGYTEPEGEYPELNIDDTDYSKYTEKNAEIVEKLIEAENMAIENGNKDFAEIQEKGTEVEESESEMTAAISNAADTVKESEDERLTEGFIKMTEDISDHNRELLDKGYPHIIANLILKIAEEQIEADKASVVAYIDALNESNSAASGDPSGAGTDPGTGTPNTEKIEIDTDDIEFSIIYNEEEIEEKVMNELDWEDDVETLDRLIDENLTDPLGELIEEENKQIGDSIGIYEKSVGEYTSEVLGFDPMKYVEDADIGSYISDIETNTYEFYSNIQESNADYAEYALDLIEATSDQLTATKEAVNTFNSTTSDNVRHSIKQLVDMRTETNLENVEMLGDFTGMLSYTRLGSIENTNVYGILANAVSIEDITPQKTTIRERTTDMIDNLTVQDIVTVLMGIGTFICILAMAYMTKAERLRQT